MLGFAFYRIAHANNGLTNNFDESATFDYNKNVLFNSHGDLEDYAAQAERFRQEAAKEAYLRQHFAPGSYGGQCVTFTKNYLGIYGTWGNGGSRLSLNSGPEINAVVIFTYIHDAVVIKVTETTITVIESNYIRRYIIGTRTLNLTDPTIKGYHKF